MVKVECDGCKAPYQIDERRIPSAGLKMRCPKCGTNLLVMPPGAAPMLEVDDLPAIPAMPANQRKTAPQGRARVPQPPPRPATRPALPEPDDDLPAVAPPTPPARPGSRPAFGEIDLGEPSLPAVAQSLRTARTRPAMPAQSQGGFGEIDLMVDLPEAPSPSPEPMAELDLGPADLPVVRPAADRRQIPAVFGVLEELEDVDLPSVHDHDPDLPSVSRMGADLPSVRRAPVKPRGRTVRFGDVDLGDDEPALPSPMRPYGAPGAFGGMDLPGVPHKPREKQRSFGEIDLPLVSNDESLPMAAQTSGLPVHAAGASLPVTAQTSGLPAHASGGALPMIAQTSGLPAHASGGALPMAAQTSGLPVHASGGALPMAATTTGVPSSAPSEPRRPLRSSPETFGEELSLGPSSGPVSVKRGAFDDSDRAVPTLGGPAPVPDMRGAIDLEGKADRAVGNEVELSSDAGAIGDAAFPPRTERPRSQALATTPPPRRSNARRIGLAAVVLLVVGGAALALEPAIGPFGVNFITDRVNAGKHAAMLGDLRAATQADLDEDTSPAAARALAKAQQAQQAAPRHQPTAAYVAFVALARSIRFGHRAADEALAKQILGAPGRDPGDTLDLANAAADTAAGQLDKARQEASAILQRAPGDPDAAALAGEIELLAKASDKALAAWKQASSRPNAGKSARVLFGLARAQVLAGDTAGATESARAAIAASPQHVGARILLASQIWQSPDHEIEALAELKKVTEDPAIRGAASDAELVAAFTLLGRIHLARSRVSAAESAFAAALKLDPQALGALIGNGELFYQSGRYSEAGARFEAAMRADDGNVAAKVGAAKTWLAQERMKEAKDLLKKVREGHAKDPAVNFWLGRVEEALGNKKEAEAAYGEAIKATESSPEVVDAYVALARLLGGSGRTDEANQKLLEASTRFPDLPALHRAKGELLLQTGRYEEARDELTAALAKDDDLGTRFKLGIAYRRMRAYDDAAKIFDKVAGVDKDYPGLALERGLLFEETGQSDKALEMYSDALKKAPTDIDLKLRVGSTQVIAGHAALAEATLREVVKARPTSAEANHFLGRALLVKGTNLGEAMRFLEAAVNIDANRAEYLLYVGWCANESGAEARAEQALKRALELDHDLADAYWQLGVWYQKQGAALDALKNLETAIQKRPTRFEAYATIALCEQDLQHWPEAEEAFRKAIAGNGAVGEWHYRLGKLYVSHGNQAGATPELELAVKYSDVADRQSPGWLFDAHFLLAEALRGRNRDQAILHYKRFLKLAPSGNAYIDEAKKALVGLHADPDAP